MGLLSRAQEPQYGGLLSPEVMRLIQNAPNMPVPQAPAAPARAPRERASFWRTLDGIFQPGGTITSSLDAERARLQTEADRPQMQARAAAEEAQRQQALGAIQDPRERALFMGLGGESWQENAGYQLRPRTLAPGSVERINGQTVGAAPIVERFDDRFGVFDPLNPAGGAQYTAPRGATRGEDTARYSAEQGARQFDQRLGVDREQLALQAELGRGGLDLNREKLAFDQGQAQQTAAREQADRATAEAGQRGGVIEAAQNMSGAATRAREFIGAAGVWSARNPLQAQTRANLDANLDTLRANLTFDRLAELKANSPTGASGLGALSDNEARLLSSTAAALSIDMSPQELERSLAVIDRLVLKMQDGSGSPVAPARASGPIAQDGQGNRIQWNGSAWVPL